MWFMVYDLLSSNYVVCLCVGQCSPPCPSCGVFSCRRGDKWACGTRRERGSDPAIPLQRLHQGVVGLSVEVQPVMHVLEVQVLVGGTGFLTLLAVRPPLVCRALQVVLVVHLHRAWQHIVHHHQPDVHASRLDTVEPVELGQQCSGVLVQVLRGAERKPGNRNIRGTSWLQMWTYIFYYTSIFYIIMRLSDLHVGVILWYCVSFPKVTPE